MELLISSLNILLKEENTQAISIVSLREDIEVCFSLILLTSLIVAQPCHIKIKVIAPTRCLPFKYCNVTEIVLYTTKH